MENKKRMVLLSFLMSQVMDRITTGQSVFGLLKV